MLSIDPQKERISLGLKQATPDPWDKEIPGRYAVGQDEKVKIVKTADFGMFVELEYGIEGLIPASEIPKESGELKQGDEVTARVIKVDRGERKIALSLKANVKGKDKSLLHEYMSQQENPIRPSARCSRSGTDRHEKEPRSHRSHCRCAPGCDLFRRPLRPFAPGVGGGAQAARVAARRGTRSRSSRSRECSSRRRTR